MQESGEKGPAANAAGLSLAFISNSNEDIHSYGINTVYFL